MPFTGRADKLSAGEANGRMKISDDYKAKFRLWAANPQVTPAPPPARLLGFKSKRFSSHLEMNTWKDEWLRQLARSAPGP